MLEKLLGYLPIIICSIMVVVALCTLYMISGPDAIYCVLVIMFVLFVITFFDGDHPPYA